MINDDLLKRNALITFFILTYNFFILQFIFTEIHRNYFYFGTICLNAFSVYIILYNTAVAYGKVHLPENKDEKEKNIADKIAELKISLWEVTRIVPRVFAELNFNLFYILIIVTTLIGIIFKYY